MGIKRDPDSHPADLDSEHVGAAESEAAVVEASSSSEVVSMHRPCVYLALWFCWAGVEVVAPNWSEGWCANVFRGLLFDLVSARSR